MDTAISAGTRVLAALVIAIVVGASLAAMAESPGADADSYILRIYGLLPGQVCPCDDPDFAAELLKQRRRCQCQDRVITSKPAGKTHRSFLFRLLTDHAEDR